MCTCTGRHSDHCQWLAAHLTATGRKPQFVARHGMPWHAKRARARLVHAFSHIYASSALTRRPSRSVVGPLWYLVPRVLRRPHFCYPLLGRTHFGERTCFFWYSRVPSIGGSVACRCHAKKQGKKPFLACHKKKSSCSRPPFAGHVCWVTIWGSPEFGGLPMPLCEEMPFFMCHAVLRFWLACHGMHGTHGMQLPFLRPPADVVGHFPKNHRFSSHVLCTACSGSAHGSTHNQ